MIEAALAGIVAGYGIAIPVGAIAILIIHTAIAAGFRRGLAAGAGTATADGVYATLAVVLGVAAAHLVAPLQTPLRLVAGVVLIVLAVVGLARLRSVRETTDPARTLGRPAHRPADVSDLRRADPAQPGDRGLLRRTRRGPPLPGRSGRASSLRCRRLSFVPVVAEPAGRVGALLGRGPGQRLRVPSIVVGNLVILCLALAILADAVGISVLP